ncbi:Dimethyladenosine transferase 2, mitochondrial [Eumeta japonica]|uniref:Dimethyladenosine transferase 2, mitochondrial n=1 Tax=Eumeta variegata TaxID=151549 RepID=A0A4C1UDZ8_EUMVA|nr:Dimethyladenosine transferase 2, mitochondrial [Eumeta japonica]
MAPLSFRHPTLSSITLFPLYHSKPIIFYMDGGGHQFCGDHMNVEKKREGPEAFNLRIGSFTDNQIDIRVTEFRTRRRRRNCRGAFYLRSISFVANSERRSFTIKNDFPKRIDYKVADFFAMAKLAFQDKMDDGDRVRNLLGDLSTNDNMMKAVDSRLSTAVNNKYIDALHHMIETDRHVTYHEIRTSLGTSMSLLQSILNKRFGQWIPGCGVWLITGQDPPETNWDLAPGPDDAKLPHMTIFTQFGDLSLSQKITVFKRFISWPEFEQCPFRVTMENNLPRFITAIEKDEKDNIGPNLPYGLLGFSPGPRGFKGPPAKSSQSKIDDMGKNRWALSSPGLS